MICCDINNNPSTSNINTNKVNNNNNSNNSEKLASCFINNPLHTISCPSCYQHVPLHPLKEAAGELKDLPAGVKFDPTDPEILRHLDAKIKSDFGKLHPFLDQFIPTIQAHNGICYTHPHKLPGVSKDGIMRHFFHCPSKAYTTGKRKRRKVHTDEESGETRWHKTGKTRPIFVNGTVKGFKKILVLYTNYARQKKTEKTNWVMHQYHLGNTEDEKDGEYVLSKVFYRTQPRQCGSNVKETVEVGSLIKTPLSLYQPHYVPYDHGVSGQVTSSEIKAQFVGNTPLYGDGSSSVLENE